MNILGILYLFGLTVMSLIALFGLIMMRSFYTKPELLPATPPAWWAYDKKWWKKWARGAPTALVFTSISLVCAFLVEYGDTSRPTIKKAIFATFFLLAFVLSVNIFTVLTGHPKWIIPKHLR